MKRITRCYFVLVALCALMLGSTQLRAQEWSAAQKEVWKNVEAYSTLGAERNVEAFLEYFHPDYCGWEYDEALPIDKAGLRKYVDQSGWKTRKTVYQDQKPVAIKIHGEFAFVHYYYTTVSKDAEGKEKTTSGRWTDILMKQGNKWVLIGDHGGQTSK
jgi:ketosteroid isomerase-like protein